MATFGERRVTKPGRGYENDAMHNFAESFLETAKSVVTESTHDIFGDPSRAFNNANTLSIMKDFFVENSYDKEYFEKTGNMAALDEHIENMEALYQNDLEAVHEYAAMGSYNPVIGLTFPVHKFISMNCMFDKCIPHGVAVSPKFSVSFERCFLVTPEREEIDMWKDQNKMYDAMCSVNPEVDTIINLPENESIDILQTAHGCVNSGDNLSIETRISAVKVSSILETGDIDPNTGKPVESSLAGTEVAYWLPVDGRFVSAYGEFDRQTMFQVKFTGKKKEQVDSGSGPTEQIVKKEIRDVVSGYMKNNKFMITSASGGAVVSAVKITSRLDPSTAMLDTCSVTWRVNTEYVEIPNATPINVPISPEEIKDLSALYNVNQVTKIMSLINFSLHNYKDDHIKAELDKSFKNLPPERAFSGTFDFAPREGYYGDHIQWRRDTFMDQLDTYVQQMIQVWNDPNVTVSIVGRAELIKKIKPQSWTYQSPASIGPVDLDYVQTVVTMDKRVYTFMSSDKMRDNNNLIIILNPKNTERTMYIVFDYQAYVSNEIRNAKNYALPAVHAFERFKFYELFSVQTRLRILNPTGLRTQVANYDPIGKSAMNDFTANIPEALRSAESKAAMTAANDALNP